MDMPTFLRQSSPLMRFELVLAPLPLNGSVTLRLRIIQQHRLAKQLKPLNLLYSSLRSFNIVKDDERLTFGFEILFRD